MIYLGNMQNDKIDSILISKVGKAEADERDAAAAKIQVPLNRFQFLSKMLPSSFNNNVNSLSSEEQNQRNI